MILTIPDIIKKKRDGSELGKEEIDYFIRAIVDSTVNDAQIGAWLMAVYLNGLNDQETVNLTKAMVETGERLVWNSEWKNILVDKHSTGGIGDKISLILAPALAACGFKVPMLSGRGLGLTGGTLDKLESIPGFQVLLTQQQMYSCLHKVGCFIAGQTDTIASADRILYKNRDLTGTVDCLPLITSSILSKKIAEGISALVMDIKIGNGALVKNENEAKDLAGKLIGISQDFGIETSVLVTNMNVPIGHCVGNALEVMESVECLRSMGCDDLKNLVTALGGLLLYKKGYLNDLKDCEKKIEETLLNKTALKKFQEMIVMQGVPFETAVELCNGNYSKVLPQAKYITKFPAKMSGIITFIKAEDIARACWILGAGRSVSNNIDYAVGIKLLKLVGEVVKKDENWIEVHHSQTPLDSHIINLIEHSLQIEHSKPTDIFQRIIKGY